MADLVTGEAVVVEVRLARLASRTLGLIIDLAAQAALLLLIGFGVVIVTSSVDSALAAAITLVVTVMVLIGYPVTFETLTRGKSLGKLALGLRVVRDDGGPIRFRHALMRGLGGIVDFYLTFGAAALICSLVNSRGKRLGDLMAGTVVVRERMPSQGGPVAQMPPWLAGWASTLDVSRVPDDLALSVRQFLARSSQLEPRVRAAMGNRLVEAVQVATGSYRPPQAPPDDYLSAVLAERRRRELARMAPPPGYGPPQPYAAPPQYAPPYPPQYATPRYGPAAAPPAPAPPAPAPPAPAPPTQPQTPPAAEPDEDGFRLPG